MNTHFKIERSVELVNLSKKSITDIAKWVKNDRFRKDFIFYNNSVYKINFSKLQADLVLK